MPTVKESLKVTKFRAIRQYSKDFQKSRENIKRSLNTMYAHGPTSYRKYESMRKAGAIKYKGVYVANLVTWKELKREIEKIDIGDVLDINP